MALKKKKIVGICGYDKEKIHTLFIDINFQKRGIGKELLNTVLEEAKKERIRELFTWSTFYAESFYQGFGFKRTREIYLPEGKKDIILVEMKKDLEKK